MAKKTMQHGFFAVRITEPKEPEAVNNLPDYDNVKVDSVIPFNTKKERDDFFNFLKSLGNQNAEVIKAIWNAAFQGSL